MKQELARVSYLIESSGSPTELAEKTTSDQFTGAFTGIPGGASASAKAIRQGRDAAVAGVSLNQYAKEHIVLRQSLQKFR